jgi:hypothetical protein
MNVRDGNADAHGEAPAESLAEGSNDDTRSLRARSILNPLSRGLVAETWLPFNPA